MDTRAFSLPSFAKINWSLRILGKRPDGYHEVRTLLQTISLHDELRFESRRNEEVIFSCDNSDIPSDDTNLIVRAANSLKARCEIKAGASLSLKKSIPLRGGLGGGSSNAAVALIGLARLWELELTASDLVEVGETLGADVPFFLAGGCALGTGIGTTISSLPDVGLTHLLVVTPNVTVSSAEAYRALAATALTTEVAEPILAISHEETLFCDSDQWVLSENLKNDFERVIFDREPEIERARDALLQAGAYGALLAGSGSSVFGIFESLDAQQRASGKIKADAGWRVFSCVTISRSEYSRAVSSSGTLRSF